MEREKLKPVRCGCGGSPIVRNDRGNGAVYIQCVSCGTRSIETNRAEAIEAWNRAMGGSCGNCNNHERTAKVSHHIVPIKTAEGYKYNESEHLCGDCKKKVLPGDDYCSHCGIRLEWE